MNINLKKKKITAVIIAAFITMTSMVSVIPIAPAYAEIGTNVNEDVVNQAKSIASVIQTRVQIYWSDWVDKQEIYMQDPLANPEPTWATDDEISAAVGGYDVPGITFAVSGMPPDRQDSFYLVATVGDDAGGAAAASYVRNYLPMAVASGNTVTVPVLRPSYALGLSDIADNPNKVNRDASTSDGKPTFLDGANITLGKNASITFDPITGGDISNVNNLSARDGTFSNNLNVGNQLTAVNAHINNLEADNLTVTNPINGDLHGNVTGNTNGTHTGPVVGNVTGNLTGNVTGNASSATKLATARTIALNNGATGTATAFDGTGNITIPVTALDASKLNSGTVSTGRLSGSYNIDISGKAATAGAADTASYASMAGLLEDTGSTTGSFTMKMLTGGTVEFGGTAPRTSVTFAGPGVTDWWLGSAGTGILHGQATSATKLATARTIALNSGATGTATAFDGTGDITIPVTALDAAKLNAGIVPTARMSGTYNIGISGKAATADQATNATNVNGGTVTAGAGTFSGALTVNGASKFNNDITIYGNEIDRGIVFDRSSGTTAKWRLYDIASGSGDTNYFKLQTTGSGGTAYSDVIRFGMDTKDAVFSGSILPAVNNTKDLGSATYKFANIYATTLNGALNGNASSATKLATAKTIALNSGATGTATAFDGTGNISIPVTDLNASVLNTGIVPTARMSGTYNIGISGKAATADQATNATNATNAVTATNISGGSVNATTGTFSGSVTTNGTFVTNGGDILLKAPVTTGGWARGLHYVSSDGATKYGGIGMLGGGTTPSSFYIGWGDTPYAPTYGITMGTTGVTALKGSLNVSNGITGALTGNASTATKLATAKTIALNTAVTSTATAFDGTANITIPVTALNAAYLNSGTVAADRLAGTYNIGISGKAATAGAADTAANATYAATAGQATNATTADSATTAATAAQAQKLYSTDNRSVSTTPDSYKSALSFEGLKFESAIGSPSGNTYSYLLGLRGWNDNSGGPAHEIAFNNSGIYVRKGGTDWEAWSKLLTSVNVENYNAGSATQLAAARTIALDTAATGTPTAFNGTANISIPVTALNAAYLNSGTVAAARMSGTYDIGISGKAATAGAADTATNATQAATAGKLVPTYVAQSSFADPAVNVNIVGTPNTNDTWIYRDASTTTPNNWGIYHRNIDSTVAGLPANSIGFIGNSALKAYISLADGASMFGNTLINPNSSGSYNEGIRLAKAANNYATIMLGVPRDSLGGITADAGQWFIASNPNNNLVFSDESSTESTGLVIYGNGNLPTWKGVSLASVNSNVASATKLATAKTIALQTAATGTATAFDGTSNITIPVSEINATYLLNGTVPTARLSGTYNIGISGKAATAGAADTASSATSATKLSTARNLNVTGAVTGTAATFDGTGNANINVTRLDPASLMTSGTPVGTRYNAVSYNNSGSTTGTIKITVPGTGINTMMNIELDVYEYNANSASKIIVGGYAYSGNGTWVNTSATVIGNYNKGVRLAYNGTNFSILLGTPTTVWSYPKVVVSKVTAGYSNVDTVVSGTWTASLVTDESDLTWVGTPAMTASQSATKLATARTISIGTGATGTATAFDGTANITIPVTALNAAYLNSGTVAAARLAGTYNIGISGKAATAGAADTAASAASASTATNVSGGSVNATTGSFSGLLTANKGIQLNRSGSAQTGISYYGPSSNSWQTIMSPAGTAGGVAGNVTSPAGAYVTSWALRNIIEPSAGYGWTWESMPLTGTTSAIVAELSSATGNFKTKGSVTADAGFTGNLTGNASTATQLAAARTIALDTAATGTPTAFNGTADISIPVTALNAGYLSAGTIPAARLSGVYNITATLAEGLTHAITDVEYAVNAGSAGSAGQLIPTYGAQSSFADPAVNINIVGTPNDRDTWIYRDASTTTPNNWGIYHRNIDSAVAGLPANSIGFIGNSALKAYISLVDGSAGFTGPVTAPTFTGDLTGNAASATTVTTPQGTYKTLGAYGVAQNTAGTIAVNTAYTAEKATYADTAGYASSIPPSAVGFGYFTASNLISDGYHKAHVTLPGPSNQLYYYSLYYHTVASDHEDQNDTYDYFKHGVLYGNTNISISWGNHYDMSGFSCWYQKVQ